MQVETVCHTAEGKVGFIGRKSMNKYSSYAWLAFYGIGNQNRSIALTHIAPDWDFMQVF